MKISFLKTLLLIHLFSFSLHADVWNAPHTKEKMKSETLFSSFSLPLKRLDPVVSYSEVEWVIIGQIYEPMLQYNYLKRPFSLEPLTLKSMPSIKYLDKNEQEVAENASNIVYSEYRFNLREDILYQNHPAFVKNKHKLFYAELTEEQLSNINSLEDFAKTATRKLTASDYAYAIKRMAVRQYHSPILDGMMEYIVGLEDFSKTITKEVKEKKEKSEPVDLRSEHILGVKVLDEHTLTIRIHGVYPQFSYWLTTYFFAPIPWEADLFYQQKGLIAKNLTLNWFPVGTGAYSLVENNPNKQMRLVANENYHEEFYPTLNEEEAKHLPKGLLVDSGKKLPFIKEVIYSLEKESIPLWNKFLQGYYDASGISSGAFDQAVQISSSGAMGLSDEMIKRDISMRGSIEPSIFYMAFNMVDPVVGGYSQKAKKLRQAISIAQNEEEYISIFTNERGIAAQGPIPPGIVGYVEGEKGTNKVVYDWKDGKRVRKSLEVAKKLLAEAGYPNGISSKTGKPLVLNFDTTGTGPDSRALMDWRRKQFEKLGIQLIIRSTDYNRFQEKVRNGKAQLFSWGWNADYPDPENFLFLLYGANASVNTNGTGINSCNYENPRFDALFKEIKTMKNSPIRMQKIEEMINIVREDAPWIWGIHPKQLSLYHKWFTNVYPSPLAKNTLKYKRIDAIQREKKQEEWNQPVLLPLILFFLFPLLMAYPLYRAYQNRQKAVIKGVE